jgi:KipI family sensor histidine kinase inhibitor
MADFGPDVSAAELHARAIALRQREEIVACIVGHQSLYIVFDERPAIDFAEVRPFAFSPRRHVIDVDFSGADLDEFLTHARLTRDDFLKRIPAMQLTARYLGFRAGFAYLEGWPDEWRMPRRATSRNLVPRGSFAIAEVMAGFYSVDSPGGWNLLGRTNETLWDPNAEPPNRFAPGDVIELRPATITSFPSIDVAVSNDGEVIAEVLAPGQLTTIVGARDWKRAEYGVSPGGPFDAYAAALANRAIGNDDAAPLLECVMVAPRLRFHSPRRAAFCDGEGNVQTFIGNELDIGRFRGGLRGYLAIEGGIDEMRGRYAEAPAVLRAGTTLRKPGSAGVSPAVERDSAKYSGRDARAPRKIGIIAGPQNAPPLPIEWEVTSQMNRVGIRLRPIEAPSFRPPSNLPSCGMQFGTLQWHPDGSLVAMGPDHPVTGGYLQPATVISADLWKLGQLSPGERIRLVAV